MPQLWQHQILEPTVPGWRSNPCLHNDPSCCSQIRSPLCHRRNSSSCYFNSRRNETTSSFLFYINNNCHLLIPCQDTHIHVYTHTHTHTFLYQESVCVSLSSHRISTRHYPQLYGGRNKPRELSRSLRVTQLVMLSMESKSTL